MDEVKEKVLVTGAFGFLGQWLVSELLKDGKEVIALSHINKKTSNDWSLKDVNHCACDVRDKAFISYIIDRYKPSIVYHLAAQALVGEALNNPRETFDTNIIGTINLLEALRYTGCAKRILVASSDKAYGNIDPPYNESTPLNGIFPYDCSKSCEDLISKSYCITYKMPISILRCGNIFGGGDFNWNRIFPEAIKSCYERRPMEIRSDGLSMIRDYVYVEDVVSAYMFLSELDKNIIANVSYETPNSPLDILHSIQDKTNVRISPTVYNTAHCEIPKQFLDSAFIRSLGWNPKYNFEEGVDKTIAWYYNYFGGLKNA